MKIDISKSLQSLFSDENWIKKVLIGTVLHILSFLLVPTWAFMGYFFKVLRQSSEGQEENLPEWDDWGALILSGLKYSVGMFILFLVPTALMIGGGGAMLMSLIAAFSGKSGGAAVGMAGGAMSMGALAIGIILSLLISLFVPALSIRFAETEEIGALFGFGQAMAVITRAPIDYLVLLLLPMAASAVIGVVLSLTGGLATILLPPVGVIIGLGMARLYGEYQRTCLS
ncbi:MAG: DUF4013 domain-containing protein [Vulcanimicrobiota bacterium]